MEDTINHQWRERIRKRRGKSLSSFPTEELNLVAMMDMMTIILVFLLKSYSSSALSINTSASIQVPKSSNSISGQEAVKLTVTTRADDKSMGFIAVDDVNIVTFDKKILTEIQTNTVKGDYVIPALSKVLTDRAEKARALFNRVSQLQASAPKTGEASKTADEAAVGKKLEFEGKILVIADKSVPFWMMASVLVTSAQSGFDKYSLVAVKQNQE